MFTNIALGVAGVFTVYNLLFMLIGLIVGIIFGALPGFSATMAVAVFVPFSYVLDAGTAMLLLSGVYCGAIYGGSIPAVLLGIPGTPASVPTSMEGHPLLKKGEGGQALGIVTFASSFGGLLSSIALLICAPLLALIAMRVGPPEQMMVAVFGLSVVSMLSEKNMARGIFICFVALAIACIGQDPVLGFPRFTFGNYKLSGGLEVVSILIGLFSLPEVFKMIISIRNEKEIKISFSDSKVKVPWKIINKNWFNLLRSSIIGIIVGIIPAAGPDIASFLAYNESKKASKNKDTYGHGAYEGLIASESANNGVTGGSLIPLLTLAIPGSAPAAIFLGAMIIKGLRPGPLLFTSHASEVYTLIVGFAVINIIMLFVGLLFCKIAKKILFIPKQVLVTLIIILTVVGSYSIQQNITDVITMFIAGVIGYFLTKYDYPLSPIALGLLLGPMLEESIMLTTTMYSNFFMIFTRPIVDIFSLFIIVSLFWPLISKKLKTEVRK
ncbi:tripartite tricarboxylate transporter TctA family protein [Treponema socranskii subsp. socranskii VPI DR56BR1116 = ATCC 35536]|uniref:Tripartite tricarboxylate transporter TctA family protein n=1 Tax=Treponema socranskii subsp. socranskii VPI DR56BR1116 = ATCC 35536 TaxID=1125725 RepID=U2MW46_TRESO|nr:tripartite tricarboxylate transporter permease [Treponema socranskii]ERF59891.1 tripartite tricarboxylate transporter TctA family protein [Treponema socranskii subsp. socranskii VPI DR56BR1116 = ATCC 35536]ERK03429.1 tripartite tricarboxylate transporter TctA family protein [Treponema socranskii subsp. socranskii VPI DR56BR1116 = ATCC 35536]